MSLRIIIFPFCIMVITLSSYAQQPYILVGEAYNAKVSKIDPLTNTKIASIQVADSVGIPYPNISNIALDTIHNWAYVSCRTANTISIIDLNTWTATYPNIPIPGLGMNPGGLAINRTADTLYVTTLGPNNIQDSLNLLETFVVSGNVFPPTLTKIYEVPVGKHPIKLILSHDGKYAVVSCRNQARVAVVNLHTNTVVFQRNYPNVNYEPEGLDIHPTANLVYCFTHGQNTIDILDLDRMAIVNTVLITYSGTPPQPSGGVFSPNGNCMLLSGQTSGKMYFFNTTDPYNPIQLPPIISSGGVQPHMAVFLNDTVAYVPNMNNTQPVGSVSIVTTGTLPTNLGNVSGIFNGPLSMVLVKNTTTGIVNTSSTAPNNFLLYQNYPNPFNPTTTINFSLPQLEHVVLKVFDVLGREVATLVNGELHAGEHSVVYDAKGLASGVYFYKIQAGKFIQQKKMEVLK